MPRHHRHRRARSDSASSSTGSSSSSHSFSPSTDSSSSDSNSDLEPRRDAAKRRSGEDGKEYRSGSSSSVRSSSFSTPFKANLFCSRTRLLQPPRPTTTTADTLVVGIDTLTTSTRSSEVELFGAASSFSRFASALRSSTLSIETQPLPQTSQPRMILRRLRRRWTQRRTARRQPQRRRKAARRYVPPKLPTFTILHK
jgi:hypothetical protein